MVGFGSELRTAFRGLGRNPGFATTVIATLALGIGATTAIFSVVSAVLLRDLPYQDSSRLVVVWGSDADVRDDTWLSPQEVVAFQADADTCEQFAAYTARDANLTGGNEPERVRAAAVTANLFATLGVRTELGRTFVPQDDNPGQSDAVLIGHGLWQRRFGGDPAVVGRTIFVNGLPRTVVGVMPGTFRLPLDYREQRPTELWTPLALDHAALGGWGNRYLFGVARLRPASTPSRTTAEMQVLWERWVRAGYVEQPADRSLHRAAVPVTDSVMGSTRSALGLQGLLVLLVLLIACVNASTLLFARAEGRRTEVAVRVALGASAARLVRQVLLESLMLALAGGVAGVTLAYAGVDLLVRAHPASIPRLEDVQVDVGVLAFTSGLCLVCAVLLGLPPVISVLRRDPCDSLRLAARTTAPATSGLRRGLVVTEIALAVALLVTAGLLIRSFTALQAVDLGFVPANVLTMRVALPQPTYPEANDVIRFYTQVVDRIEQIRGVRSAAAVRVLPLNATIGDWSIAIEGQTRRPGENPNGDWQVVTPAYFETLRIPIARGRGLARGDNADAPPVAVVNDTMARRYWPGNDAIGRRFRLGTRGLWITIVGIVPTIRHNGVLETPRAEMYLAHAQFDSEGGSAQRAMTIVVRSAEDPASLVRPVRDVVRAIDPGLPVADVRTLDQVVSRAVSQPRFAAVLVTLFAAAALVLATIGIAGLVAFDVARRQREIGIRLALGGVSSHIVRLFARRGLLLAISGIGFGIVGAVSISRLVASQLVGVSPTDGATYAAVALLVLAVVLATTCRAAWRAARLDPILTLKAD